MSGGGWTPGPWAVARMPGDSRLVVFGDREPGQRGAYDVAICCHAGGADEANSRLIAAAPDCVAALADAVRELRMLNLTRDGEQRQDTPAARVIERGAAALAKAGAS